MGCILKGCGKWTMFYEGRKGSRPNGITVNLRKSIGQDIVQRLTNIAVGLMEGLRMS